MTWVSLPSSLQATDDAAASVSIPLTLTVANVNDAPEQLILQGQVVNENDFWSPHWSSIRL